MSHREVRFGPSTLRIKKFDLLEIVDHATICIIAKRGSGKTFLVKDIMYHKRHLPACIAISKTEKLNRFYGNFIPDSYIYSNFDTSILSKIYNRQSILNEDNKQKEKESKPLKDDRIMLIMDDCMSSKATWVKDPNILELFFNGRHHHISFILTMQFSLGINPELRSNFDYIFLLAEDFISNRKRIYDHFAGCFPTFEIFQQVFTELTENFSCVVINNRVHSKDITDKIFWYKAKEVPDFTLGSKKYVKYHKRSYDEDWNKRVAAFDPASFLSNKKNNTKITVEKIK